MKMANKQQYAERGRSMASTFSNLADDVIALQNVYFDRGYNDGGADELTDQDVASAGVTAADVTGMITFAGALETFLVANRGYISKMRNDL
jgi:hypothetical protein